MKECALGTAYDPDPILSVPETRSSVTRFEKAHNTGQARFATELWVINQCSVAPTGAVGACVCLFSQIRRRLAFPNVNFGVFPPHPHYYHLALRIAHNVPWMSCLGDDPPNALLRHD
jgi:hypothetical protein